MNSEPLTGVISERKDSFGQKVLFKLAATIGIGWQVMLLILRFAGIVVGVTAGIIIGILYLVMASDPVGLLIATAFIAPPIVIIGITELWIWLNPDPVTAWTMPY
jgi:hypothetical protein